MKKRYLKSIYAGSLALALALSSCKKTINIQPRDQVDATYALSTKDGIDATITSMYSTLKIENLYGNRLIGLGEALADNGVATNKSGRYVGEAANTRGSHYSHWSNSYNVINRINLVLSVVPTASFLTDAQKSAYTGELKFLRALYYFDLVKAYAYIPGAVVDAQNKGGVPLILQPTQTIGDALTFQSPRASIADVYKQIYADLDDAVAKITTASTVQNKATKYSAEALYSRVALYNKDYAKVITLATDVINNSGRSLLTANGYVTGWSQQYNPESLFEVAFTSASESLGVNVSLQTLFTSLAARGNRAVTAGFGDLVPSASLINALGITVTGNGSTSATITARSSDVRNLLFEIGATGRSPYYVECTKFIGKSGSVNLDNVPVIRIAEMYLNRAEAEEMLGQDAQALVDVNSIRTNRGLAAATALTGTNLLNEILLQRRLEFAFEGQRFLDLKRRGQDITKQSGVILAFTDPVVLPQIPTTDVNASNGVLVQNYGY